MFTSRFTIFALLTFLAGVNAGCATCPETLEVDGVATYKLVSSYVKSKNGFTECSYTDKKGDEVTCEYARMEIQSVQNCQGRMIMDAKQDPCDVEWARREEEYWSAESWVYQ
ncbi:hypothetical protein C8R48DRAFT_667266 [Suillus tomentosus]|nr:hypothetical protein C8R48DRAFT_667266 [Suillus tomentosus]